MIGTTVGNFKILEKIGEGGMGVVYKARDTRLDRIVALKFLPERLAVTEEERARFLVEAKAAATLNHPNVCTIHGVEEDGTQQFIQMEFVEGETLHEIAHRGGMPSAQALDHAIQIAEALHEAHQRGIVHRDIKSENIMINTRKQVKVMDFGLAKLRGSLKLTKASSTIGTLGYMAPEQIEGNEADARADLFSFGVVLYEMLTGRLPFRGEHEAALMYSILNEDPQPLTGPRGETLPELEHIIGKALEKDPEERYQSAQDLLVDLRRARKQSGRVSRVGAPIAPSAPPAAAPERRQPSWRVPLLAGAGVIVVAVVALVFLTPEGHRPFEEIDMSRITSSGRAGDASISPDGKVIAHSVFQQGKSSIWIRQVATGSSVQVAAPFEGTMLGTSIMPDGEFLLYAFKSRIEHPLGALYKVPLLGGQPRVVLTNLESAVGVSSDGSRLAFLRQFSETGEEALMIASADGSGEKKLVVKDGAKAFFISQSTGPAWSPDDRLIAVSGGTVTDRFAMGVLLVSVEDGSESWLGEQRWGVVNRVAWLPDGSGVIVRGNPLGGADGQIWCLDYPEGSLRRVTNDLNAYEGTSIGITRDGRVLSAVMVEIRSSIWTVGERGRGRERQVTGGGSDYQGVRGLDVLPDGRLLYGSLVSGNGDLWLVNPDGSGAAQLTVDPADDFDPVVAPDGFSVVFVSERSGTPQVWKINIDGTGLKQLTTAEDYLPTVSPDGRWVYYASWAGGKMNIWRVQFDGGTPEMVVAKPSLAPQISPDGKFLACSYQASAGTPYRAAILPIEGGEPLAIFDIAGETGRTWRRWSADGKNLLYIDQEAGVFNVYAKPVTGDRSQRVTQFESGVLFGFAVSRDGSVLAVARGSRNSDVVLISDIR